jgi:hypothetical protein
MRKKYNLIYIQLLLRKHGIFCGDDGYYVHKNRNGKIVRLKLQKFNLDAFLMKYGDE